MQSTFIFEEVLDRLKHELRVTEDQEVADFLGLAKAAFSARKKRGSFPDKELLALTAKRPDLNIDYDYVVTGHRSAEFDALIEQASRSPLSTEDERLAGMYAALSPGSRKLVFEMVKRLRELELILEKR